MRGYAVVLGEALIDLLETSVDGEPLYRPAIGGGPLNVAVGVARLGGCCHLLGSVGDDAFGRRIRQFLEPTGVVCDRLALVPVPTTLAVTSFEGSKPDFHFYGEPPSYGQFELAPGDPDLISGASVLYCGSIAVLCAAAGAAARRAWEISGPLRVFDPNARPALLADFGVDRFRDLVAGYTATADLVKLSLDDAAVLYPEAAEDPRLVADLVLAQGTKVVVVTLGPDGALLGLGSQRRLVPGSPVEAVDTTGAGDACMATLIDGLLRVGMPDGVEAWIKLVEDAMRVAAVVCRTPGGAGAMPTRAQLAQVFPK